MRTFRRYNTEEIVVLQFLELFFVLSVLWLQLMLNIFETLQKDLSFLPIPKVANIEKLLENFNFLISLIFLQLWIVN